MNKITEITGLDNYDPELLSLGTLVCTNLHKLLMIVDKGYVDMESGLFYHKVMGYVKIIPYMTMIGHDAFKPREIKYGQMPVPTLFRIGDIYYFKGFIHSYCLDDGHVVLPGFDYDELVTQVSGIIIKSE